MLRFGWYTNNKIRIGLSKSLKSDGTATLGLCQDIDRYSTVSDELPSNGNPHMEITAKMGLLVSKLDLGAYLENLGVLR